MASKTRTTSDTPGRDLIESLKRTRPDVLITVTRGFDPDPEWLADEPQDDTLVCYEHTVTAITIRRGVRYEGTAYLGGSWYHPDDDSDTLKEASGYLEGMVNSALKELDAALGEAEAYQWKCDTEQQR